MVPPLLSAASVLLLISQLLSAAIGKESCNNCELDYGEDYENASANEETHVPVSDPIKGAHSPPTKKPNGLESPPTKRPIRIPGSCYIPPKDGSKETSYLLIERVQSISVCARICAQTRGCIAFAYKASINQCRPSFSFSGNFVADASGGMQWSEMAPCDGANLKTQCYTQDVKGYKEASYIDIDRIPSMALCKELCTFDRTCVAVAYNPAWKRCNLRQTFTGGLTPHSTWKWSEKTECV